MAQALFYRGFGRLLFFSFPVLLFFFTVWFVGLRVILPRLFPVSILSGYPDFRHPDIRM